MAETFVDTTVLAYLFDDRSPAEQARAEELLLSGVDVVISTQVMLELHSVLTRKFVPALSPEHGRQVLTGLARWEVVPADAELVLRASRTAAEHPVSMWDAMIVEAARQAGCERVWTEDLSDGTELRGVRIVDPFTD